MTTKLSILSIICLFILLECKGATSVQLPKITDKQEVITSPFTSIEVSSAKELLQAIDQLIPGTCILLEDGRYNNINLNITAKAPVDKPITLKAKNPGQVQFTGDFHWTISGDHIEVSGIHFTKGTRKADNDLILDKGQYNQYNNCKFNNLNDVTGTFIKLEGQYTRVEQCAFTGKTTGASYINMDVPKAGGCYHFIKRNYFSRPPLGKNGGSAMRVGHGSMAMHHAYITIEENLFENCDGESEIVSVKSSRNYIRNNTFRSCKGAFSLRQGRGSIFEGNFFIGDGKKQCGGLTIRGRDHFVFNNYFYNLKSKKSGIINFGVASPEDPERIKLGVYPRHFPLTQDIIICHNTIIANHSSCHINFLEGYGTRNRFDLPVNIQFYNNVFDSAQQFMDAKPNMDLSFETNYYAGKNLSMEGIIPFTLKTYQKQELVLPVDHSAFVNQSSALPVAQPHYNNFEKRDLNIDKDIQWNQRDAEKDPGCFELGQTASTQNRPLKKDDVGCDF
ncbi:MAG: polysaccharide lyase 6 family protein [Marinilabiliaceae bacterium]|nr:polysaccharide lyase 6 family protein [Marinilabiliaceae bacterium]